MSRSTTGSSLIAVMIAWAMIGGLSIFIINMIDLGNQSANQFSNVVEQTQLKQEVGVLLSNKEHCIESFSGKSFTNRADLINNGMDIVLRYRGGRVKFNTTNKKKYGKLEIKSIKFFMDGPAPSAGYSVDKQVLDGGRLDITVEKRVGKSTRRTIRLAIPMKVKVATTQSESGLSHSIVSCGLGFTSLGGEVAQVEVEVEVEDEDEDEDEEDETEDTNDCINVSMGRTFVGCRSGSNTTGSSNSFFGSYSGDKNTGGINNSFFGASSGERNTIGHGNSFFGMFSGRKNIVGQKNSFFGLMTGHENTSGRYNSFFGYRSGEKFATGNRNLCLGYEACKNASPFGHQNIHLDNGEIDGAATTGSGNIVLGTPEDADFINKYSNRLAIGNIIEGNFIDKEVKIDGKLQVSGNITAPNISTPSDKNLKEVLGSISDKWALAKILALRSVRYRYKEADDEYIGLIAQEVREVLPELVSEDANGNLLLNYQQLIPLLTEAISHLSEKVDRLEKLEERIFTLERELLILP